MTYTISVTQEHIEKGTRAKCLSCPIALAMRDAGIVRPVAGLLGLSGRVDGKTVSAPVPDEADRFMVRFDELGPSGVSPFTFTADFKPAND